MTYNFDADRWYERQRNLLDARLASGDLDADRHARELDELEQRYEDMTARLDGSFQLPATDRGQL